MEDIGVHLFSPFHQIVVISYEIAASKSPQQRPNWCWQHHALELNFCCWYWIYILWQLVIVCFTSQTYNLQMPIPVHKNIYVASVSVLHHYIRWWELTISMEAEVQLNWLWGCPHFMGVL